MVSAAQAEGAGPGGGVCADVRLKARCAREHPTGASGAWWMNHGLDFDETFRGDFQAAAFRLDRK